MYSSDEKTYRDFRSLRCWQSCREVKLFFYEKIIPKIPHAEKNNTSFQIRKSARSITANIAESSGRYHYQDTIQFLRIARGSLEELFDDLIFCLDIKCIDSKTFDEGESRLLKAKANLNGFIHYNESQKLKQTTKPPKK